MSMILGIFYHDIREVTKNLQLNLKIPFRVLDLNTSWSDIALKTFETLN